MANTNIHKITDKYLGKVKTNLVTDAKNLAPVKTGALKASIKAKIENESIFLYSDVDYAIYVEMGTRHMTPQSFLRASAKNRKNYKTRGM